MLTNTHLLECLHSGDYEKLFSSVKRAYSSKFERITHLDSKAGNYIGIIAVILTLLSLLPLRIFLIGVNQQKIVSTAWPEFLILIPFLYTVLAFILSAYYFHKALELREYEDYFTAEGIREQIENSSTDKKGMIVDLLLSTKKNEIYNLKKRNAISVAQTLSRNALITLGISIMLIILFYSGVLSGLFI